MMHFPKMQLSMCEVTAQTCSDTALEIFRAQSWWQFHRAKAVGGLLKVTARPRQQICSPSPLPSTALPLCASPSQQARCPLLTPIKQLSCCLHAQDADRINSPSSEPLGRQLQRWAGGGGVSLYIRRSAQPGVFHSEPAQVPCMNQTNLISGDQGTQTIQAE